jgi:hypothetical protein
LKPSPFILANPEDGSKKAKIKIIEHVSCYEHPESIEDFAGRTDNIRKGI